MTYALVVSNTIQTERGALPLSARRLDDQAWVVGLATAPVDLQRASGWFEVVDVARPADTPTHTHVRSLTLVDGAPTVTWTQRPKTAQEIASATAQANDAALRANPQTQIEALIAAIAALQVIVDTSNATINANPASALKAVAREAMTIGRRTVRLARLQLGALDSTTGT